MLPTHMTIDLYQRAQRRGWWYRLWGALRGRSSCLLDLTTVASSSMIRARHAAGLQIVPIRQILGSEGRTDMFDAAFHPIRTHTELRWRRVARAGLAGITLPPVELIRIGETYFVRDGHHRISVARALGQREIDAVVTVWDVQAQSTDEPISENRRQESLCTSTQGVVHHCHADRKEASHRTALCSSPRRRDVSLHST